MGMPEAGSRPEQLPDIDQEVVVRFHYPVRFTRGLFAPRNRTLRDAVQANGRARLLVVVDDGVARAQPATGR